MFAGRTLDGTLEDMLNPSFRTVDFADDPAVKTIASYMRHCWVAIPPPTEAPTLAYTQEDIGAFIRSIQTETETEREERPKNADRTVYTPWREAVYRMWNHVFTDVMLFLPEVGRGIGHFHFPSYTVLPLSFPGTGPEMAMKWATNMLIIPTYLGQGVQVRMSKNVDEWGKEGEHTLGKFDGKNECEIWWVRKGTEVKFHLEAGDEGVREGEALAAVLMLAVLCDEGHGHEELDGLQDAVEGEE